MRKFAVNIMGYVEDPIDKYTAEQIERMLSSNARLANLSPMNIVAVTAKELPDDSISIDKSKVKKHYRVSLTKK